ncbi:MAG TPA: hypothetical protein VFT59_00220 [Candidatus Saccharimonadales bacterium]|nr:hypothetical protein [Candidatus Saccharimonadales bacterium]
MMSRALPAQRSVAVLKWVVVVVASAMIFAILGAVAVSAPHDPIRIYGPVILGVVGVLSGVVGFALQHCRRRDEQRSCAHR